MNRKQFVKEVKNIKPNDTIIISQISDITHSITDLIEMINQIKEKDAYIKSQKETWLDTTIDNPNREILMTILQGIAQSEKEIISTRSKEGIEAAKEKGIIVGRPKKADNKVELAIRLKNEGMTVREVEELTGVSRATIYRRLKETSGGATE